MSTSRNITAQVLVDSNPVDIISLEYNDGYKTPINKVQFETDSASIDWLGKTVSVTLARDALSSTVFSGYVDEVNYTRLPGTYEVVCSNILIRASNHWLVAPTIDGYWERSNIAAENLVRDLLLEAGISNYYGATSSFTFGVQGPAQFNLVSSLDAIEQINHIIAYNIHVVGATVRWERIAPVPAGSPSYTIDKFISITKTFGTRNLRNKVVVFGKSGIYAEASAVSPYLPENFYQTAIVSSELIDSQSMADQSAAYNLNLYNRPDQELKIDIEGDPRLEVMQTVHVTHSPMSIDDDWFIYSLQHTFDDTFTTSLTLRR